MGPLVVNFVRYGIPVLLIAAGQVAAVVVDDGTAAEAWAGFTGAGLAVLLLNMLFRIGVQGDRDRDREEEARRYFDEHGHWPGEGPPVKRDGSRAARRSEPAERDLELRRPRPRRRPP